MHDRSPGKKINQQADGNDPKRIRSNNQNGGDHEKGKEVEEEELEEAQEKRDDLDGSLVGVSLRRASSDMEGEGLDAAEGLRWTHMNVRRMLQEVKKRASTTGTAAPAFTFTFPMFSLVAL